MPQLPGDGSLQENCRRKGKGSENGGDGGRRYAKGKGKKHERHGKERFRQIWRIQGRISRRTERLCIRRTVPDVRQGRATSYGESLPSMRKMQTAEKSGAQTESEDNGEVKGVWIVASVEEIKDEERTREYHTHREVEEGTGRAGVPIQVLGMR